MSVRAGGLTAPSTPAPAATGDVEAVTSPPSSDAVSRRARQAAGAVFLVLVAFLQDGTLLVADTKLDLSLDVRGFLARAFQAWDAQAAFGQVQNQAYGYLWPMGTFFAGGDLLGVPAWAVQRLWWCLVLLVAYTGFLRLTALWGVGTPVARILGALLYALSPRLLSTLGPISVESWPTALLPWLLVPLVLGSARGSPRRHALAGALVAGCLGGVNAAASLAVLTVPFLYLVTRERGPRRRSLLAWWCSGTLMSVAWWVLPLLVLARTAYPFLDYIETASATTAATSAFNVLRGTDHWLGFVVGDAGPAWPTAFWLSNDVRAVAATAALATLGMLGLLRRSTPERWFLAVTALTGAAVIGIGYAGAAGSPVSDTARMLLDGPLAPLRNVHKFDALLRLPLTVGVVALAAAAPRLLRPLAARMLEPPNRHRAPAVAVLLAVLLLLVPLSVLAWRPLTGALPNPGSFPAVPSAWSDAAAWLRAQGPRGTALLVPASNFGEYSWGRPMDEPMQAQAETAWAVRNAVPLGAPGATRWLDGVQVELAAGAPSAALVRALAEAGVTHVLLRNDLSPYTAVLPSAVARATLITSPGLHRVAGFGDGVLAAGGVLRQLEVFRVDGTVPVASTRPVAGLTEVVGGPEALVTHDVGGGAILRPDAAAASAAGAPLGVARTLVTDTLRRRAVNFGAQRGRDSTPTLPRGADVLRGRRVGDVSPFPPGTDQTTLSYVGIDDVTASTTASDPFAPGYIGPQTRPFAAVDGDERTAWVSGVADAEPWWEVAFPPREVRRVVVRVPDDPSYGTVAAVRVTTDAGTASGAVDDTAAGGVARVDLPGGSTRRLRVDIVRGSDRSRPVAVSEVEADALDAAETVVMPAVPAGADVLMRRVGDARRDCVPARATAWTCSPGLGQPGEESVALDRSVQLTDAVALGEVRVRLVPGPALDTALDRASGLAATASSRLVDDPAARPGAAVDLDPATAWISDAGDERPALRLSFSAPVAASRIAFTVDEGTRRRLAAVRVTTESGTAVLTQGRHRAVALPRRLTGRTWAFTFVIRSNDPTVPAAPIAVHDISFDGRRPVASDRLVVPCGAGPAVDVSGRRLEVGLDVGASAFVRAGEVDAAPCGTAELSTGQQRVRSVDTELARVEALSWGPAPASGTGVTPTRPGVSRWDAEGRQVTLAPGPTSLLVLAEGYNSGWGAAAGDGSPLIPVRVDGWRQAWVVPASANPVVVDAEFTPGRWHRAGLLVGALLLALLVVAAAVRARGPFPPPVGPGTLLRGTGAVAGVAVAALLAGPAGALVALGAVLVAVRSHRAAVAAVSLGMTVAIVAVVVTGLTWGPGAGPFLVQVLSVGAVAVVAATSTRDASQAGAGTDPTQQRSLQG